ncbi:unnamed protein product [Ambrosiozyma monospora]|uniref:Unnamed protein product n=1 Tax=Ambrosiozyma monospora TaxID=43982 RepID=A0ACB5T762_AMBMO|nr:unnamed protein product [Ambrosiozyma monospora]
MLLSETKHLDSKDVKTVLNLFKQRNFDLKLRILSKVVGTAGLNNDLLDYPDHSRDDGLIVTEIEDGGFTLLVKTYAGSDSKSSIINHSITSYFKNIKDFAIYFRQPNEPTTYKSKNNMINGAKRKKTCSAGFISSKLVKRPLNSFLLYRTTMVKAVVLLSLMDTLSTYAFGEMDMDYSDYDPTKEKMFLETLLDELTPEIAAEIDDQFQLKKFNHHLLIQIVSLLWTTETPDVKNSFFDIAKAEKEIHKNCFPEYKYRPNRGT